jgi:predicted enzyme related to lactoylglutathione lyase
MREGIISPMAKFSRIGMGVCVALLAARAAGADVSMNSVRVAAKDTVALAKFYQAAFGMVEVNRINAQGGPEIFLNFGATADAAKANTGIPLVLMHRDADDLKDPIAHVIFNATDIKATVAAIKAAGGTVTTEPFQFGTTGILIAIAADPVGNRIELLQRPAR